jgi:hypothetical protein
VKICHLPGWTDFPIEPDWEPFRPFLSVGLQLGHGLCVSKWFFDTHETQSLSDALRILHEVDIPMSYTCLPLQRVAQVERTVDPGVLGAPWETIEPTRTLFWELDKPLNRPTSEEPCELTAPSSELFSDTYGCEALFRIYRGPEWDGDPLFPEDATLAAHPLELRLAVAAKTVQGCCEAWESTAAYLREM